MAADSADLAWWQMEMPSGNIMFHKRKAEMIGYPPERFQHYSHFTELVHPDDYNGIMQAMTDHLMGAATHYEGNYRILTSWGEYKWFYDKGAVVERSDEGVPLLIIGFVVDISKQKQAELEILRQNEELKRMNEEKDRFLSILGHDLRGPLGGFVSVARMLKEEGDQMDESTRDDLMTTMLSAARNSYSLLENLLKWGQSRRGLLKPGKLMIVLEGLVADLVADIQATAYSKGVMVEHSIPSHTEVYADPDMLRIILRNLISNAVKFSNYNGMVYISSPEKETGQVCITVQDTGIGMSREMVDNLFRLDVNTKRPGTNRELSSGLGLLLARQYIYLHGGELIIESEEGKGTAVTVVLPA
jgi:PAS domain S-box-containing protein